MDDLQTIEAMRLLDSISIPYEFTLSRQSINRLYYCRIYHAFKGEKEADESYIGRGETVDIAIQRAYIGFQSRIPWPDTPHWLPPQPADAHPGGE